MDPDEVTACVSALGGSYLCITGGEPLLQGRPLLALVESLARHGYMIDIETNGTMDFTGFQDHASICMDVKCPSSGERSDLTLLSSITGNDSVKFVVRDLEDCRYAEGVIEKYPVAGEIFSPRWRDPMHQVSHVFFLTTISLQGSSSSSIKFSG